MAMKLSLRNLFRFFTICIICFFLGQYKLFDLYRQVVKDDDSKNDTGNAGKIVPFGLDPPNLRSQNHTGNADKIVRHGMDPPDLRSKNDTDNAGNRPNLHSNSNNISVNANDNHDNSTEPVPNLLSSQRRKQHHLFVHIGKAGGSSIQVMVKKSRKKCKEMKAEREHDKLLELGVLESQVCALSKIPDGRVHLKDRLAPVHYKNFSMFLINLRDPIDRLVSWYNYEIASFRKEARWRTANETGQASDNFQKLTKECYPTDSTEGDAFAKMVEGGLLSVPEATLKDAANEVRTNPSEETCDKLARLCLRGDIMCFGHNYYNYEVYLEEILRRKGFSTDDTAANHTAEDIRIDAIRSEFSMQDFNRTVGLWTSRNLQEWKAYEGVTPYVQSLYGRVRSIEAYDEKNKEKHIEKKKEVLSAPARTALCKHICRELVVYKIALGATENLDPSDIRESFDALDDRCGFAVDEVCGTTWTYRNIKKQKRIFESAPW